MKHSRRARNSTDHFGQTSFIVRRMPTTTWQGFPRMVRIIFCMHIFQLVIWALRQSSVLHKPLSAPVHVGIIIRSPEHCVGALPVITTCRLQ